MVNMSWITQTSGGSCSMALSRKLGFIGLCSSLGILLVSQQASYIFSLFPKAESQADREYRTCFLCFHNSAPLTNNNQLLFISTNTESLSKRKRVMQMSQIFSLRISILFQLSPLKTRIFTLSPSLSPV